MKKGLTSRQVVENREKFGTNKLPEKKMKTGLQFFMETFKDHINQILLAMMIVFTVIAVFGQGSYSEPIGVAVVLLAIALLGMNIGLKSQKSEKELRDRTSVHYCNVVRDGKIEHINTDDLVVGDLVIVQSGEAIYADGYLVEGNLKVDNSVLNGESEPCKKSAWNKGNPHIEIGGKRKANHTNKIPEAGNIQLLCTDKTGTLTVGKLVPVENVMGNGEKVTSGTMVDSLFKLNVALNSSAMYDENKNIVGGNATERALLTMIDSDEYKTITDSVKVTNAKSFNSANKFSAVETDGKDGKITYYKGAPERLIDVAVSYEDENGTHTVERNKLKDIVKSYTVKAMRVIATGYSRSALPENGLPDDLIITSLVAIRDDVRPEVPEAVERMHDAGVQVMMVTGDVIDTAKAIAKDAGLIKDDTDIAMSAIDFDALSDEEAKEKLPHIKVIARATPNTKLRIVRLAQELGLCVGMTGDGTNDAPALKAADVGFSMGSGTDVCKEAGDIIITDDNFVSITDAVLLGRTFMHNVMKFLKFQLPINVGLVILSILYPIIMAVEAVAAVQILVINIVMDSLNSLSFGGEPAKEEYMKEKPIPKGSKLLSKETVSQIAVSVVAFIGIFGLTLLPAIQNIFGNNEEVYATARFALLVMMATFNGFNIRTDGFNLFKGIGKNKLFVEIAIAIFAITFLLAQFGGEIMGCTVMTPAQWAVTVALAFLIIPIDLVRKAIIRRK